MYWLFNNQHFTTGPDKITVVLSQKRAFRGQAGDMIVFFQFNYNAHLFTYLYKIIEVPRRSLENSRTPQRIPITLQRIKSYGEEKEIEDYIFSFPRIKYFRSKLFRHFNKRYYKLTEREFLAITEDRIFVSRTILGTALNYMHIDHRRAFSRLMLERYPDVLQNNYKHTEILSLFKEYFNYSVEIPARQLLNGANILSAFLNEKTTPESVGFIDSESNRESFQSIGVQARMIRQTLEQLNISILEETTSDANEYLFESLFRNKPLPIDLND